MKRRNLLGALFVLPLVAGGVVVATTNIPDEESQSQQSSESGYVCPVTGEMFPCPNCCPLNRGE